MKNIIIPVFTVIFCAFACRAYASDVPGRELSLDECMTMALENNMSVRNAELDVFAARAQKQEAFAEYFPKVSVNAFAFYAFDPLLEIGVTDILGESDFSRNLQDVLTSLGSVCGFDPV